MDIRRSLVPRLRSIFDIIKWGYDEMRLYWRTPRPGEYVCYREIVMLSIGWMALNMCARWAIGFGGENAFTTYTLGLTQDEGLNISYICTVIGYITTPLNAYIIDNLRSKDGKYRVYIKLAIPSMLLTIISLWLPYAQIGAFSRILMLAGLFLIGQVQGYIQGWLRTGVQNMVYVITPNTQERTKIMSIVGIISSFGSTVNNLYDPIMVDVLGVGNNKYSLRYFRGTYTPVALLAPLVLVAYFGTKERLILPKSRITKLSFTGSMRAVAGNKIFWIKCADGWNDFMEGMKGNVWDSLVYRAHIMKSTTYGILNTICYNASFWSMLFSPWFIRKFGKRKIKIFKNIVQIFLIAAIGLCLESKYIAIALFVINAINRFIDCGEVIDKSIEADMRDNQQYLIGERIDGAFGFIQSYAGSVISLGTRRLQPWVYKREGVNATSGAEYDRVLNVYLDYDQNKPLSEQTKNPDCILYKLLHTLIWVSVVGAAIDVLPWFLYDISETDQKAMIRVIRIRTIVEDRHAKQLEAAEYIEGCEALFLAEKYCDEAEVEVPHKDTVKAAKSMPNGTREEHELRSQAIKEARNAIDEAKRHNEEITLAKFVMHEIHRFEDDFGKQQLELARKIVSGGPGSFYENAEECKQFAKSLPKTSVKEERQWRAQDLRNVRQLRTSARLAKKHYPDGVVEYDNSIYDAAYNMPDTTKEEAALRRAAMRKAAKQRNTYANYAAPYLYSMRLINLYEGYHDLISITEDYDETVTLRKERLASEEATARRLEEERKADVERKKAERRARK